MEIKLTPENISEFYSAFRNADICGPRAIGKRFYARGAYNEDDPKSMGLYFDLTGRIDQAKILSGHPYRSIIFRIALDKDVVPFVLPGNKDEFKFLFFDDIHIGIEGYDLKF
ncbi:MAG: hypothetical protein V1802_02795 [Candidatus Aenigmatarchaeota archaeon]